MLRGAVTLYLVITGTVYELVLAKYCGAGAIPRNSFVERRLMPVVRFADWPVDPARPDSATGGW